MKKIIGCLCLTLVAFTWAPSSVLATESNPSSLKSERQQGEMVKIGGQDRPDLIKAFDDLKATTVMTKGKVYAKTPDKEEEHAIANSVDLSKLVAQSNVEKSERAASLKAQKQSKPCMNCPACGGPGLCTATTCFFHKISYFTCQSCPSCSSQ